MFIGSPSKHISENYLKESKEGSGLVTNNCLNKHFQNISSGRLALQRLLRGCACTRLTFFWPQFPEPERNRNRPSTMGGSLSRTQIWELRNLSAMGETILCLHRTETFLSQKLHNATAARSSKPVLYPLFIYALVCIYCYFPF